MSEQVTAYAVVKGENNNHRDVVEEIVAVYSNEDVAVNNAYLLFRPNIRERVKKQGRDPREGKVTASPISDRGIYVRVEETVLKDGLVKDVTIELTQ